MSQFDFRSRSIWMEVDVAPDASALRGDCSVDVAVVGAGITGLSIAYELVSRGRSVVVIDRGRIAGGMTARTTAHLAPICDDSLSALIASRGTDLARLFQESQAAAVTRIEQIKERENIDCMFRRTVGVLFPGKDNDIETLDEEAEAADELGIRYERGKGLPFPGRERDPTLRYAAQATFHPLLYLRGIAEAIVRGGGRIHCNTCMTELTEDGDTVTIATREGPAITAKHAVVATNAPVHERLAIHTKQAPYRTYAMAFGLGEADVPDALFWDTEDPYHYVRRLKGTGDDDVLIVGGEDHKTGEADDADGRFARLDAWIRGLLPDLGEEVARWSGQVMDTLDYTGFIGLSPGLARTYLASGDSGQGMTHGVAAGLIIPALIDGEEVPAAAVYDPARIPVGEAARFLSENMTAIKNFAEYAAPGEVGDVADIAPNQGAIVREGGGKLAVFRDADGNLHRRSAACTHVGCHLHWNSFERTWDCPCHGSHFLPDGNAVNGPAIAELGEP